jgi:hypothetical protein
MIVYDPTLLRIFAHTKRRSGLADATVLDVVFDGEHAGAIAEVETGREHLHFLRFVRELAVQAIYLT